MHQNDAHNIFYFLFNIASQRKKDQSKVISLTIIVARNPIIRLTTWEFCEIIWCHGFIEHVPISNNSRTPSSILEVCFFEIEVMLPAYASK
jgi:hypothetical protein